MTLTREEWDEVEKYGMNQEFVVTKIEDEPNEDGLYKHHVWIFVRYTDGYLLTKEKYDVATVMRGSFKIVENGSRRELHCSKVDEIWSKRPWPVAIYNCRKVDDQVELDVEIIDNGPGRVSGSDIIHRLEAPFNRDVGRIHDIHHLLPEKYFGSNVAIRYQAGYGEQHWVIVKLLGKLSF